MTATVPNLLIIGAVKAGTSSLHHYLDLHPEVAMSARKELGFFMDPPRGNWDKGWDWYRRQWPSEPSPAIKITGEATPQYSYYPRFAEVPERIAEFLPQAKILYLVRDPVARIVSHYLHNYRHRYETDDINSHLLHADPEDSVYFAASRYAVQIERYLKLFPREQIQVVELEQLKKLPDETMASIFTFLGIDAGFRHEGFAVAENRTRDKRRRTWLGEKLDALRATSLLSRVPVPSSVGALYRKRIARAKVKRPELRSETIDRIQEILHPDVQKLRRLFDRDFDHWQI
ncbi:MAG: sulfotransferase [Thermoanaerobaculia bacterium]|nr:sulfotransferase [Thermoanaerobaculia bacterium]